MFGISWLQPNDLIHSLGALSMAVVMLMIFAETGLLVGFFLPGDSLLFAVGLALSAGIIPVPLWLACLMISGAGFAGDQTGYWIGRKAGPRVFNRPDSRFFSQKNVSRTNSFFERYGNRAVVLAHFVPVMRTFVPVAAGIGQMPYRRFLRYNIIGVVGWGSGVTLLGAWLGKFQFVADHVEWFTLGFVVVSTIPIVLEILKARRENRD
jgi:membrane-associated protein